MPRWWLGFNGPTNEVRFLNIQPFLTARVIIASTCLLYFPVAMKFLGANWTPVQLMRIYSVFLLASIKTLGGNFLCKYTEGEGGPAFAYLTPEGVLLRKVDEEEWDWAVSVWKDRPSETMLTIIDIYEMVCEEEDEHAFEYWTRVLDALTEVVCTNERPGEEAFFLKCEALERDLLRQRRSREKR